MARRARPSLATTAASAGANARVGAEMMEAAQQVVAARLDILSAGLNDPLKADLPEIALMGAEKVEALTLATAAATRGLSDVGQRFARDASREAQAATSALTAMVQAGSPAAAYAVQMNYALGWWGRATGSILSLNAGLAAAQAQAMAPLHRTATANARRLARR